MLLRFFVRVIFAAIGLAIAAHFVPGIAYSNITTLCEAALLLGVVNAILRPILTILTLPLTIITLGLWLLVLNAGMIALVSWLIKGFEVHGLIPALLAAVVTGVTSWIGHMVVGDATRS
jgi:putative membrane protein